MSKKTKTCNVTITALKKDGVIGYTATIDQHGPAVPYKLTDARSKRLKRYTAKTSAKRAALSNIDARTSSGEPGRAFRYAGDLVWFTPAGHRIVVSYK